LFKIDIDTELGMITIAYRGEVHVAERSRALDALSPTLDAMNECRILLDFMAAHVAFDSFEESRILAHRLSELVGGKACRVAYLAPPGEKVNVVVETLAFGHGLIFVRFFQREEAIRWLLSDEPEQVTGRDQPRRDPLGHAVSGGD
jgi:hypothetical protein